METRHHLPSFSNHTGSSPRFARNQDRAILGLLKKNHQPAGKDNNRTTTKSEEDQQTEKQYYRCRACKNPVAECGDEISVGDIPIETMQINPHGYVHEIFTVRSAFGVMIMGDPVPADSWFPGYMWRYCLCVQCNAHLGWSYQPVHINAIVFFGLRNAAITQD